MCVCVVCVCVQSDACDIHTVAGQLSVLDTSKNDVLVWIKSQKLDDKNDAGRTRDYPTMGHRKPHAQTLATANPRKPFKVRGICIYVCMCVCMRACIYV